MSWRTIAANWGKLWARLLIEQMYPYTIKQREDNIKRIRELRNEK